MRAVIISIIILVCMLSFSVFNTIYINMKVSELTELAETIDHRTISEQLDEISSIWKPLSDYLHLTVTDTTINPVEKALEHLRQIVLGSKNDLSIARSDLIYALSEITELEEITFLQIF